MSEKLTYQETIQAIREVITSPDIPAGIAKARLEHPAAFGQAEAYTAQGHERLQTLKGQIHEIM